MSIAVLDLCTDILREIRVINAIDAASAQDAAYVLRRLNTVLDQWAADKRNQTYGMLSTYPLHPGLQPHTIGPATAGGTWSTGTQPRPISIEAASLMVAGISTWVSVRPLAWWQAVQDKGLTSTLPSDLYYEAQFPLGQVYLWPVPTTAYDLVLQTRGLLQGQLTLGDTIDLPPGYKLALLKQVALEMVSPFGVEIPPLLPQQARDAVAVIQGANIEAQPMDSDAPGQGGGFFDHRIGRYM